MVVDTKDLAVFEALPFSDVAWYFRRRRGIPSVSRHPLRAGAPFTV